MELATNVVDYVIGGMAAFGQKRMVTLVKNGPYFLREFPLR